MPITQANSTEFTQVMINDMIKGMPCPWGSWCAHDVLMLHVILLLQIEVWEHFIVFAPSTSYNETLIYKYQEH